MKRLSTITALFVLALAGTAFASSEPEIDGTPSVRAVHSHGKTVITFKGRFGRRLYKRIAGHDIKLPCQKIQSTFRVMIGTDVTDRFDAPKHGHKLRVKTAGDWCELVVVGRSDVATPIVAVALTRAGRAFLAERFQGVIVDALIRSAKVNAENGGYPAADSFVSGSDGRIVALASPSDTPPPGRYGFYSDGAQHIEAVGVTPAGQRLFEEVNGDTLSSNVAAYVESIDFDYLDVGD